MVFTLLFLLISFFINPLKADQTVFFSYIPDIQLYYNWIFGRND